MPVMTRKEFEPARSDEEKADRRQAILAAAEALVEEGGVDQLSMNVLAKRVGLAKGTLYLYFATREELLLGIYGNRMVGWCDAIRKKTRRGMSDTAFCKLLLRIADNDPLFVDLTSRLATVIEENVSLEAFAASKRASLAILAPLGEHVETCLDLRPGEGLGALSALTALLIGSAQLDSSGVFPLEDLPEDVALAVGAFKCQDVFLRTGPLVLADLRKT